MIDNRDLGSLKLDIPRIFNTKLKKLHSFGTNSFKTDSIETNSLLCETLGIQLIWQ